MVPLLFPLLLAAQSQRVYVRADNTVIDRSCEAERGATTAELRPEQKSRISHRGRALRALAERLEASG